MTTMTPKRRATTTVCVQASVLRDLFAPVVPLADQGDTMPVLAGIHVTYGDGYLFATATDRYRIGVQRVLIVDPDVEYDPEAYPISDEDDDEPFLDVVVPLTTARSLLKLYRVTKVANPTLVVTFDDTPGDPVVVVSSIAPTADGFIGTTRWELLDAEYPKMNALFDEVFAGDPHLAAGVNLDLKLLAGFETARTHAGWKVPLQFFHGRQRDKSDGAHMVGIRAGHNFVGAIMGVRGDRDGKADPLPTRDLDESWASVITAARKVATS